MQLAFAFDVNGLVGYLIEIELCGINLQTKPKKAILTSQTSAPTSEPLLLGPFASCPEALLEFKSPKHY